MEEDRENYVHLHKLSAIKSENELQEVVSILWETRKRGLSTSQKSHLQSLLNLTNRGGLIPVLACLRSLIRKCTRDDFAVTDILKLLPPDVPFDLQKYLVAVFERCQLQWKEEISTEQPQSMSNFPRHINAGEPQQSTSLSSLEVAASARPLQDIMAAHRNYNILGASDPIRTNANMSRLASARPQQVVSADNLGTLPHLKSMTWALDNQSKTRRNKVAVISLMLQDYTKSTPGETEVKFQLTRDKIDAILKSMTYINEKLSNRVRTSSETVQEEQMQ